MTLAVTGGTGFVGRHLLRLAGARGIAVRALTRRPQPPSPHVEWIAGDLADTAALDRLYAGAGAVVHIAGVITAPTRAAFDIGNVAGTNAMAAAARRAGISRFVHVSSLSAREPGLSDYGASKAAAEDVVRASGLDWTMVRPPGVYGPGDRETLPIFQMAARGVAVLPGGGRFSLIEVGDLAAALLALTAGPAGRTYEIDDGHGGYSHADLARAIGVAVGRTPRLLRLPLGVLNLGATVDSGLARLRGRPPRLSFDRARYLAHPDWVVAHGAAPPPDLWTPATPLAEGLARAVAWYRAEGWLRG